MKKINYIISVLLFLIVFTSCDKDFLELTPEYAIDSETALADSAKLEAFIAGIYDINTDSYYTGYGTILTSDARGGDVIVRNYGNYGRFLDDYQFNLTADYFLAKYVWQTAYELITATNLIINSVPETSLSDNLKKQVIAEAKTLRATAYMNLLKMFTHPYSVDPSGLGVPIVVDAIGPSDEFPARGTIQEVYVLILSDLVDADANLGDRNSSNVMRMTSNLVDGLLARVYLNMENWADASTHAQAARVNFPLSDAASLGAGFVDPTSEWIWANDHREDDNNGYVQIASFYDPNDDGYSSFKASQAFVGLYEAVDARMAYFGTVEQPADAYKVNKFDFRGTWDLDLPLMRSAEMYLIEAEAEAELGNDANSLAALNEVQTRANATLTAGLSGQALVDAVLVERRKELFGEGFASYDLQRRNLPLLRNGIGHWHTLDLPANDNSFLYPIPQAEIDANSNIKQNDGY